MVEVLKLLPAYSLLSFKTAISFAPLPISFNVNLQYKYKMNEGPLKMMSVNENNICDHRMLRNS